MTPISILIQELQKAHEFAPDTQYIALIRKAKKLLIQEKHSIIDAYENGWVNALKYDLSVEWGDEIIEKMTGEEYYNEIYKSEK